MRAAVGAGARIVPIPGACAAIAAFCASGMSSESNAGLRFFGFLPRGGPARRKALALITETREPVVLYESGQRIADTLADLASAMPTRSAVVARELTKVHEELVRGLLEELAARAHSRDWIGEIVVVLGNREETGRPAPNEADLDQRIDEGLTQGRRAKDLAEELSLDTGLSRRDVYARIVGRRR